MQTSVSSSKSKYLIPSNRIIQLSCRFFCFGRQPTRATKVQFQRKKNNNFFDINEFKKMWRIILNLFHFYRQRNCSGKPLNHSINDVLIDEHFACIEQNTRMVGHVLNVHIHDTYYWYVDRNADLSSTEGNRKWENYL